MGYHQNMEAQALADAAEQGMRAWFQDLYHLKFGLSPHWLPSDLDRLSKSQHRLLGPADVGDLHHLQRDPAAQVVLLQLQVAEGVVLHHHLMDAMGEVVLLLLMDAIGEVVLHLQAVDWMVFSLQLLMTRMDVILL